MTIILDNTPVLVVGAGIMGSGIAQVAAQAGHPVMLFDAAADAAIMAKSNLESTLSRLVTRGKFSDDEAQQILAQIDPIDSIDAAASAGLVIEAVVEDIEIKRDLFQQLEVIVGESCVFASNTSSLSISAIANGLQHPERLVGMHFFNPAPIMKLVEIVSGLQTSGTVAENLGKLVESWGKVAVHTRSTPGFIVNRIARPFYAETLALLQEQAATPALLDACLRGAGFRMGPCELMDLIGHDTNFTVTRTIYEANFQDRRYTPSQLQRELVAGGMLGRKIGRGFYHYPDDKPAAEPAFATQTRPPSSDALVLHGSGALAAHIEAILQQHACHFDRVADSDWIGLQAGTAELRLSDGRCASELGHEIAVFDLPLRLDGAGEIAWSHAARASQDWIETAPRWLSLLGFVPLKIADVPGLVVARTIAMLINEAADAVQQGVCDVDGADAAMKLGVNYPAGPFEWLAQWDSSSVVKLLDHLDAYYRGERYRVSPWLRHQAWQARDPA